MKSSEGGDSTIKRTGVPRLGRMRGCGWTNPATKPATRRVFNVWFRAALASCNPLVVSLHSVTYRIGATNLILLYIGARQLHLASKDRLISRELARTHAFWITLDRAFVRGTA